ncbi:Protein tyrosine kinase 9/actin monomer-binding protein [Ceraceosorus bombacis]|uniref:Protein tyrosine kinase 9/actin monomer-binding protein n=1 Tax=Ceraceosorus bombacis TaxID=401625 RepID=A0A0P1BR17_9BASI|nr:Protein tyrosine kinase 9/actin monomer-binding protein [Ceraceosorus bombacis]
MSLSVSPELKQAFDEASSSLLDPEDTLLPRAFLVRLDGKQLVISETRSPSDAAKSEWSQLLEELLTTASTTPGYVLYRLDSRSSAGQYEWLLVTFRPDGAPIKQRMQYGPSQEALTRSLGEWSFLETIHASTPKDCIFPTKLRSDRKHDYQNPQVRDKTKTAAEQAGASVGGARRYFQPAGAKAKGGSGDDLPVPKPAAVPAQAETPPTPLPPLPASAPAPPTPIPGEEPPLVEPAQAPAALLQPVAAEVAKATPPHVEPTEPTVAQELPEAQPVSKGVQALLGEQAEIHAPPVLHSEQAEVLAPPLPADAPVPPTPDPKEPAPTVSELGAVGPSATGTPAEVSVLAEAAKPEETVEEVPPTAAAHSSALSESAGPQSVEQVQDTPEVPTGTLLEKATFDPSSSNGGVHFDAVRTTPQRPSPILAGKPGLADTVAVQDDGDDEGRSTHESTTPLRNVPSVIKSSPVPQEEADADSDLDKEIGISSINKTSRRMSMFDFLKSTPPSQSAPLPPEDMGTSQRAPVDRSSILPRVAGSQELTSSASLGANSHDHAPSTSKNDRTPINTRLRPSPIEAARTPRTSRLFARSPVVGHPQNTLAPLSAPAIPSASSSFPAGPATAQPFQSNGSLTAFEFLATQPPPRARSRSRSPGAAEQGRHQSHSRRRPSVDGERWTGELGHVSSKSVAEEDSSSNLQLRVMPVSESLVMFGSTHTSANYSVSGRLVLTIPLRKSTSRIAEPPEGNVKGTNEGAATGFGAKPTELRVTSLRVYFAGYAHYVDHSGRFSALRLADVQEELLPQGYDLPLSSGQAHASTSAAKYDIEFTLGVPGWLPASITTRFGGNFYCLRAEATYVDLTRNSSFTARSSSTNVLPSEIATFGGLLPSQSAPSGLLLGGSSLRSPYASGDDRSANASGDEHQATRAPATSSNRHAHARDADSASSPRSNGRALPSPLQPTESTQDRAPDQSRSWLGKRGRLLRVRASMSPSSPLRTSANSSFAGEPAQRLPTLVPHSDLHVVSPQGDCTRRQTMPPETSRQQQYNLHTLNAVDSDSQPPRRPDEPVPVGILPIAPDVFSAPSDPAKLAQLTRPPSAPQRASSVPMPEGSTSSQPSGPASVTNTHPMAQGTSVAGSSRQPQAAMRHFLHRPVLHPPADSGITPQECDKDGGLPFSLTLSLPSHVQVDGPKSDMLSFGVQIEVGRTPGWSKVRDLGGLRLRDMELVCLQSERHTSVASRTDCEGEASTSEGNGSNGAQAAHLPNGAPAPKKTSRGRRAYESAMRGLSSFANAIAEMSVEGETAMFEQLSHQYDDERRRGDGSGRPARERDGRRQREGGEDDSGNGPRATYNFTGDDGHGVDLTRGRVRMTVNLPLVPSSAQIAKRHGLPQLVSDFESPYIRIRHKLRVKLGFGFGHKPLGGVGEEDGSRLADEGEDLPQYPGPSNLPLPHRGSVTAPSPRPDTDIVNPESGSSALLSPSASNSSDAATIRVGGGLTDTGAVSATSSPNLARSPASLRRGSNRIMPSHVVDEELLEGQVSGDRLAAMREHQQDLDELRNEVEATDNPLNSSESGTGDEGEDEDEDEDDDNELEEDDEAAAARGVSTIFRERQASVVAVDFGDQTDPFQPSRLDETVEVDRGEAASAALRS